MESTSRRRTVFPGNEAREYLSFTSQSRKRRAVSPPLFVPEPSPPISPVPPIVPSKRREIHRQSLGPLLPVKLEAKVDRSHLVDNIEHDASNFDAVSQDSPWKTFRPVLTEDQAGPVTLAHQIESNFKIVAIRKRNAAYRKGLITRCSHKNLVALQEVFFRDDNFYFVYEPMAVSLAALQCVPGDKLLAYEIAAVSKEVLQGLKYLHDALKLAHGALDSTNVMFDNEATIKLANIGDSMLKKGQCPEQDDLRGFGILVLHMMEPGATIADGSKLAPQHPEDWKQDMLKFLDRTQTSSATELLQDEFLKISPGPMCLKPRVLVAERAWFRDWEICYTEAGFQTRSS